jgi:hypothetical protein
MSAPQRTFSIPETFAGNGRPRQQTENVPRYSGSTVVSLITVTVTEELIDCTYGSFER